MVKHIILWTLNPELSEEEKQKVKAGIKAGLEGLVPRLACDCFLRYGIQCRKLSSS